MKLLIIDGNNLLHRVYWIAKKQENYNVNHVVLSFLKSIRFSMDKFQPEQIICTWDKKLQHDAVNFRINLSETEYKANRSRNDEIYEATYIIDEFLAVLGIKVIYPGCLEADDIMHYISVKNDDNVIISSDKDILQLVSNTTKVYNPIKKILYNTNNFESLIGSNIKDFILLKAIVGDVSDNISGLKGYGIKRAKKLIEHPEKITDEQLLIIEKNLKLIDLSKGWQVNEPQEEYIYREQFYSPFPKANKTLFNTLCQQHNLNGMLFYSNYWDIFFKEKEQKSSNVSQQFECLLD